MKCKCSIVYIMRNSEIILSPLNENNPTFIYTKYSVKTNKVTVHCGDHGGLNVSESSRVIEISVSSFKA
jgi:hypothetical protein